MVVADRAFLRGKASVWPSMGSRFRGNDELERWELSSPAQPDGFKAMMRSVEIENFRGLKRFTMQGLGRVNLLVGRNNCGKTSVLEALYLLAKRGDPHAIEFFAEQRGEMIKMVDGWGADISHMFSGHRVALGGSVSIEASEGEGEKRSVSIGVEDNEKRIGMRHHIVSIHAVPRSQYSFIDISNKGGFVASDALVDLEYFDFVGDIAIFLNNTMDDWPVKLPRAWDNLSLTSAEQDVIAALCLVDCRIERIASTSQAHPKSRGGFRVKLKDEDQPLPIGNLGDGLWRMLALALSLNQARGGMLLIDEIDTGLHHSVMVGMWKMIVETAKKLDVQVFASTHSRDCVHALASVCRPDVEEGSDVTIQRIEAGKEKSVPYSEAEIISAAEYDIEVR